MTVTPYLWFYKLCFVIVFVIFKTFNPTGSCLWCLVVSSLHVCGVSVTVYIEPMVRVSNVESLVVDRRAIQLTWSEVTCSQRLGLEPRYDILLVETTSLALAINVSTDSTPPVWVYALHAYTQYTVRVRYANEFGMAPYSDSLSITTLPDGTYTSVLKAT